MGKTLVESLAQMSTVKLFVINRSKVHWNNEVANFADKYTHYYGDRDSPMEYGKLLTYLTKKVGIVTGLGDEFKWDLVVDFCAYLRKEVKSAIRGLSNHVRLYVFISTDSIYDVCDKSVFTTPLKEEQDIRPSDPKKILALSEDEEYGHDKLRCEEYLKSHCLNLRAGFPYICLRLPDVIGPYDSTGRFWAYMLWVHKMASWPIHTKPENATKPLSLVYSIDVCNLLISLLPKTIDQKYIETIHGQSFNIAFEENLTLNQIVQGIADCMGLGKVNFIEESSIRGAKGKSFYPSVYCPHLDISKAKKLLKWKATPIQDAIHDTALFFSQASKYTAEMKKAMGKLAKIQELYEPDNSEPELDDEED